MKNILLILYLLFVASSNTVAQKYDISGRWKLLDQSICDSSQKLDKKNLGLVYIFDNNGKVEIFKNHKFLKEQNYLIEDNILNLENTKYKIEHLNEDSLIISECNNNCCRKTILISVRFLISMQKTNYFINFTDTVYYPIAENEPILKNDEYLDYVDYFQTQFMMQVLDKENQCKVKLQFIIDKEGTITNPYVWNSCNKKYDKFLIRILEKTKSKWTPLKFDGKNESCLIVIKFTYNFAGIF